jgi:hypothetical protein
MVLILFRIERHCTGTLQQANASFRQKKLTFSKIKNGTSFAKLIKLLACSGSSYLSNVESLKPINHDWHHIHSNCINYQPV